MVKNREEFVFFGGGNIAQALIKGLLDSGRNRSQITVVDPKKIVRDKLQKEHKLKVNVCANSRILSNKIILLAVKPNKIQEVCKEITSLGVQNSIIISVAAGTTLEKLIFYLPEVADIIRAVPNTPCLVKKGATVLISNRSLKKELKQQIDCIFSNVGRAFWTKDEKQLDTATAISGSGPAYFYYFCESMVVAATELGMSKKLASDLVNQTLMGAATLNQESEQSFLKLRKMVSSKGGTTEAAINSLLQENFRECINKAIKNAHQKSIELSKS